MVTLKCMTPILLSSYFLPQGFTMDCYSNTKAILGNTGKIYKVAFPYLKDNKQYLPFNKLVFRILDFYSYGNDSSEIVLSPKEVRFMCLACQQKRKLKSNNFT